MVVVVVTTTGDEVELAARVIRETKQKPCGQQQTWRKSCKTRKSSFEEHEWLNEIPNRPRGGANGVSGA